MGSLSLALGSIGRDVGGPPDAATCWSPRRQLPWYKGAVSLAVPLLQGCWARKEGQEEPWRGLQMACPGTEARPEQRRMRDGHRAVQAAPNTCREPGHSRSLRAGAREGGDTQRGQKGGRWVVHVAWGPGPGATAPRGP